MTAPLEASPGPDDRRTITVSPNGPYLVSGGVPLVTEETVYDDEGSCRSWARTRTYPARERYALCRCGQTTTPPFCDGTHGRSGFDGTEANDRAPFLDRARITRGPSLTLADNEHLCVHAGFCHRDGGIWNLVRFSDAASRATAIEEACDCPAGRLVVYDNATGEAIERDREQVIALTEDSATGEGGPLWVRGGVPVISADGTPYEVRNRVALCRCGRSKTMPFCDGSHIA